MKIKPLNYFRCLLICLVSVLLCACQAGWSISGRKTANPIMKAKPPRSCW